MLKRLLTLIVFSIALSPSISAAQEMKLEDLVHEALNKNPEIQSSQARIEAARYRIPQARSLPDPTFTAGYQNEGLSRYTYGEMQDSYWTFTASQMFPLWGKRGLKGEMAEKDAQSLAEMHRLLQLKTASRVSELYFDLFLAHKNVDLIRSRAGLFSNIEEIAASRYAAGRSTQQEVLMAQTEKYMLLEREEMLNQKIQSLEAMLRATLGRESPEPLGKPAERPQTDFVMTLDEMLKMGESHSPEIQSRLRMIEAAEAKVKMAKREYYPDVTVNAGVLPRGGDFENMYNLTATINVPLWFQTRQRPAVQEANAGVRQAKSDLEATRLMIGSAIRDNYSMIRSSGRLLDLYRNGLIPKTYQDFQQSVSGYGTGRVEAIVAITRLKNLIDYENLYWNQYTEREKAITRMHAIFGEK